MAALESLRLRRDLRAVPVRVLVNGTRGKSTVTRLVAAALREAGVPTLAKTTGSAARIIGLDGTEKPVRRPFGARLTEQKSFAREAAALGARATVVECMALRPESQEAMARHFVRPTLTVVTNARVDHIDEIGSTPERTAEVLALSVPADCILVTAEPRMATYRRDAVIVSGEALPASEPRGFSYAVHADNLALALKVAEILGVDRGTALRGMRKARPDSGVAAPVTVVGCAPGMGGTSGERAYVVNAFAANDVESTLAVWREARAGIGDGLPLVLLFNNRADREYRIAEFARLPARLDGLRLVAAAGDYPRKVARALGRSGVETLALGRGYPGPAGTRSGEASADSGAAGALRRIAERVGGSYALLCAGNYHGFGEALTAFCAREPTEGEARCSGSP